MEREVNFNCMDCDVDTKAIHEYYTVWDSVWLFANPADHGILCIGCLEERLGRRLVSTDFPDFPINYIFQQSNRLRDRIGVLESAGINY